MGKAVDAVSALQNGFPLHIIQKQPHLLSGQMLVVQPFNEPGNGLLKIDVVFPKRVVSVNEQHLAVWMAVLHGLFDLTTESTEEHRARSRRSYWDLVRPLGLSSSVSLCALRGSSFRSSR